jgi:hypothetical protein
VEFSHLNDDGRIENSYLFDTDFRTVTKIDRERNGPASNPVQIAVASG